MFYDLIITIESKITWSIKQDQLKKSLIYQLMHKNGTGYSIQWNIVE